MKGTRYLCSLGVAWLAAVSAVSVRAHDLPLEVLTYVKAEGDRLRVLVRVPPEFLRDAGLPVRSDGYLDLQALGGATGPLSAVVSDVTRNLDLMQAQQPLPAPRTSWTISRRSDTSFETYEGAVARLAAPALPAAAGIDPAAALVDVQLDYPIAGPDNRFSIRVNGFRANRPFRMQVRYVPATGAIRRLITTGAARRIELEPRWQTTAQMFARLGVERLTEAALPLLFLLSLAIPPRPLRTTLTAFGVLAIGVTVALAIAAFMPGLPDQSLGAGFQSLAAAVLAVAALQNITRPRFVWVKLAAAVFGLATGFALGNAYRADVPLAGAHTTLSLLVFTGPILVGWLWLLVVAQRLVGFVHQFAPGATAPGLPAGADPLGPGVRGRWAIILLSAIVIHAALHGILVGS